MAFDLKATKSRHGTPHDELPHAHRAVAGDGAVLEAHRPIFRGGAREDHTAFPLAGKRSGASMGYACGGPYHVLSYILPLLVFYPAIATALIRKAHQATQPQSPESKLYPHQEPHANLRRAVARDVAILEEEVHASLARGESHTTKKAQATRPLVDKRARLAAILMSSMPQPVADLLSGPHLGAPCHPNTRTCVVHRAYTPHSHFPKLACRH